MARIISQYDPERDGTLEIEECHPNYAEVYFVPPKMSLELADLDWCNASDRRVKLLDINGQNNYVTIHPVCTFANRSDFLQPKYGRIERITLENPNMSFPTFTYSAATDFELVLEFLEELPSTFIKDFSYGLGLAKPYRFIVDAVLELSNCTDIVIADNNATGPCQFESAFFYISKSDFEQARRSMNSIGDLAQKAVRAVRSAAAYNIFAARLGVTKKEPTVGRHPYRRLFTGAAQGQDELSKDDQNAILSAMRINAGNLTEDQPEKMAKLRSDIELVTLEQLIQKYECMLGKRHAEDRWQAFFNENSFILNMAFGYPVVKVRDQASVGGRKLSGDGEKITDFLVKNSLTNNTAIFEIKTPQTAILNKKPFREGVFTPSAHLSGSINQALDQKYQFQKQITAIKENTRLYDIESYAVHCCLVIGKSLDDEDRMKSFELFRRNSKDVDIITFDELLEKLKQLCKFLRTTDEETSH